jgi:hypothetical protein
MVGFMFSKNENGSRLSGLSRIVFIQVKLISLKYEKLGFQLSTLNESLCINLRIRFNI